MNNYMVKMISSETNILGLACITTGLVNEACRLHGASATAAAALGRALTGGALMASLMKEGQRLALKFEADGPIGKMIVEADSSGAVRGFVSAPDVDLPLKEGKLDVSGAIGQNGFLTVTKDTGLKETYTGIVRIRTGGVAEDIAYYFVESEQIPSAVGLGVFVEPNGEISAAGGFLIQTLPPSDEQIVDQIIARLKNLPPVTQALRSGKSPEDMLEIIFEGIPCHVLEKKEIFLQCSCRRERIESVLVSLGSQEIAAIIAEQGETEVTCEFCRTVYHFDKEELEKLLLKTKHS